MRRAKLTGLAVLSLVSELALEVAGTFAPKREQVGIYGALLVGALVAIITAGRLYAKTGPARMRLAGMAAIALLAFGADAVLGLVWPFVAKAS